MSVLVVGISHKSAPVAVLERLAVDRDGTMKLVTDIAGGDHVNEALAIVTCNRLEVYADVDRFHGGVEDLSNRLIELADERPDVLLPHLYVHYDDGAVSHLFNVASGLDSMVMGEGQILGQTREALRVGQELGTVGPTLNSLFQQALRVGKRAHAETDIDHAAPSMVTAALERTAVPVAGSRVVVVGAGAMASLAVATVARQGAASITVVNRTAATGERLADEYSAVRLPIGQLEAQMAEVDLAIFCTGAASVLLTREALERARTTDQRPLSIVDLALPHDVDPAVAEMPGVDLTALSTLARDLQGSGTGEVESARQIVGQEIAAYLAVRRKAHVTPTVVALRSMATAVVESEIERLEARLPGLDSAARAEVVRAVRRVADKLLHEPTVRLKELADEPAKSYTEALTELFDLDREHVEAVTRIEGTP